MNPTKKIWHDKNNVPPTNYVWYKNGKYLENIDGKWVETSSANSGSGISPDMTTEEKMEARKDLGLYYEETVTGEKDVTCDSEYKKLSDDTPGKEDIVSVNSPFGGSDYTITDIENGYRISVAAGSIQVFTVFTSGDNTGIYGGGMYAVGSKLVYNGTTDVISKVPEKFLPIGWNQLVTEGTKIAELTIGNEKTNVFAPNGGGGLATITGMPTAGMTYSQVTAIGITPQLISSFASGEVSGLVKVFGPDVQLLCVLSAVPEDGYGGYNSIRFTEGTNLYSVIVGSPAEPYAQVTVSPLVPDVPGPVEITGLPDFSMTSQSDLDAIGLTTTAVGKIVNGAALLYKITMPFSRIERLVIGSCNMSGETTYKITFSNEFNKYEVVATGGITVTVTSLS